jgi:MerR family transcriptional regulator, heat shock protein HspR
MTERRDRAEGSGRRALDPDRVRVRGPAASPAADEPAGLAALDDVDAPVYTIGQAAELLGVPVAALRRLDEAGAVHPARSDGRHRRYSRRQLRLAQRVLTLVSEGTTIAAASRIADLEGEVDDLRGQLDQAARPDASDHRPGRPGRPG